MKKKTTTKHQLPNRTLYQGDNLPFLRALNCESVDLICIDPPFNKGKDFHATPDSLMSGAKFQDRWSWEKDVHEEWVDQIKDDHPRLWAAIDAARKTAGDDMGAFCCFLSVRLLAMHRVLKETGSIFVHLDSKSVHYIKTCLDAIFGAENFINEITWKRVTGGKNDAKRRFPNSSDRILAYAKGKGYFFKPQYREGDPGKPYRYDDDDGRGIYRKDNLQSPTDCPANKYDYKGYPPPPKGWLYKRGKMEELEADNRLAFPATKSGRIALKRYLSDYKGVIINDNWTDIGNLQSTDPEKVGYPTQKPIALLKRQILAASNPGDVVADFFAGCATTCVAAELTGRRWIGADLWDKVGDVIKKRMNEVCDDLVGDKVNFTDELPQRTDEGKVAAPAFQTPERFAAPGKPMSRAETKKELLKRHGIQCQGCLREFDHEDYLEIDHIVPKKDGGINHISNRTLLCGPCNRRKSARLTLTGLRELNKKQGFLADERKVA